jgi:hypothetical protein
MVEAIDELQLAGVRISDVYANAFTKKGKNIATKIGLRDEGLKNDGRPILVGRWTDEMREKLVRRSLRAARHA